MKIFQDNEKFYSTWNSAWSTFWHTYRHQEIGPASHVAAGQKSWGFLWLFIIWPCCILPYVFFFCFNRAGCCSTWPDMARLTTGHHNMEELIVKNGSVYPPQLSLVTSHYQLLGSYRVPNLTKLLNSALAKPSQAWSSRIWNKTFKIVTFDP